MLTPFRGEPTNKVLKRLQRELQANASSIETNLEGRNYRYLGLVLADEDYMSNPNMEVFIPPTYPLQLNILADATAIQALELKDVYIKNKSNYLECKNVEKVLLDYM